jgi:hypothetical protein
MEDSMLKGDEFNASILDAVTKLYEQWGGRGYDIDSYFTHNLQYGPDCCIKANNPPKTMCVAAAAEVIVAAPHCAQHSPAQPCPAALSATETAANTGLSD